MFCVNDQRTETTCGACEDVRNGTAPFTCRDCTDPGCSLSGNREIPVCYLCNATTSEATGHWYKIGSEEILFCSPACAEKYARSKITPPRG
jgi:hypothetical protein